MAANNSRVRASTTAMTLHERFTILRRAGPARTKRGAAQARESAAEIARGSSKNKRLALQMEKRFASGGTPAKKAVQQQLGQTATKRGRGTVTGSGARARGQLRSASRARGVRSRVQTTPKPQTAVSPKRGRGLKARSTNRRRGSSAVRPAAANQSPAVTQNVRGRGLQRGGRGRGRGRGGVTRGSQSKKPVSKEELDQQLDQYMSGTKTVLNTHTPDVMMQ